MNTTPGGLEGLLSFLFGGGGAAAGGMPPTGPSLLPNAPTNLGALPTTALQQQGPMLPQQPQAAPSLGSKAGEALLGGAMKGLTATPPQPQMNLAQSPMPRVGGPPGGTQALGGVSAPSIDAYIKALMARSAGRM